MGARIAVSQAVDEYLADYRSRGLAASTMRGRKSFLTRFAAACNAEARRENPYGPAECRFATLKPAMTVRFFSDLKAGRGSSNNALGDVRSFFKWCVTMKYLSANEARHILGDRKMQKYQRKPKYYIPRDDFELLLKTAGDEHPESRAVVGIGLFTLCRVSEMRAMRLQDVSAINRQKGELPVFRQKMQRYSDLPIPLELDAELDQWLAFYASEMGYQSPAQMILEHPDWYLLPRRHGVNRARDGRWSRDFKLVPDMPIGSVEGIVKRTLIAMGAEPASGPGHKGEGAHTIRRSGARALFDYLADTMGNEKALIWVSRQLDHDSTDTTMIYIGVEIEGRRMREWLKGGSMYGMNEPRNPRPGTARTLRAV